MDTTMDESKMSWNQVAIQLSNQAMDDLQERGDLLAAYLNLSGAVTAIGKALPLHHHESTHNAESMAAAYSYSWVKCSNETFLNQLTPQANEGYLPFMCLRFLRIKRDSDTIDYDSHCPCQFSWAVYYNVGILCTVLGTIMGRQTQFSQLSKFMLEQGRSFMDSVLIRVEAERPDNKDWATVHLSILVNQALGDLEGRIAHYDPQLHSTPEAVESLLKRTRDCLQAYSRFFAFEDLMEFHFSMQPLLSNHCAQAA